MNVMNYIPDIITIVFIIVFILFGMKKGFIHTLLHSASFFIAIVASFCFANPVTNMITNSNFGSAFRQTVYNFILKPVKEAPEILLKDLSLPDFLIKGISESEPVLQIAETLAANITNTIISVLVFILLFVLTKIALKFIDKSLGLVTRLPVLKQFNSLFGALMGFVSAILWIYVITSIIAVFSFIPAVNTLTEYIMNSQILSFLYKNNLIIGLFS